METTSGFLKALRHRNFAVGFIGAVLVIAAIILYHAFWWNRVLGLEAGSGQYVSSTWLLENFLPYRDYFEAICPLSIFSDGALLSTFGKYYYVTKGFGVIYRVLIAVLTYFWLKRLFKPGHAAFAAIITTIAGSSNFIDPLDGFHQQSEMYAIAAGLATSYLVSSKNKWTFSISAILTGCFAALAMCTKQSVGLIATVCIPIGTLIVLTKMKRTKSIFLFALYYSAGYLSILGILVGWLHHFGILASAIHQIFVQGPAGKASNPFEFVRRFILVMNTNSLCVVAALFFVIQVIRQTFASAREEDKGESWRSIIIFGVLPIISIGVGIAIAFSRTEEFHKFPTSMLITVMYFKVAVLLTAAASVGYALGYIWKLFWTTPTQKQSQLFLFSVVSSVTFLSTSLSFPLTGEALLPGLALVVAPSLEKIGKWRRILICGCWCIVIIFATDLKCSIPYGFQATYEQAGRLADTISLQPALRGFILPKKTVAFVDGTLDIIKKNTSPGDTIFTYPEIAILYALSGKKPPTWSPCHIIDITTDKFGAQEAARLLEKKPAVLVYMPDSDELKLEEDVWRFGKPSGNRKIVEACEKLGKEYKLAGSYLIGFDKSVLVYVKQAKVPANPSEHQ